MAKVWWWALQWVVVMILALGVIVFMYWMRLPDVAGALGLSGLGVLLFLYFRSQPLIPWHSLRVRDLRNSTRWDLSKALICAGAGLDFLMIFAGTESGFGVYSSVLNEAFLTVVMLTWLFGTAFLLSSIAAYLLSLKP